MNEREILVTCPLPDDQLGLLSQHCAPRVLAAGEFAALRESGADLARYAGLICLLTDRVDRDLLARMPALAFVSSVSVGVDHIDLDALTGKGIAVGHTPGVLVDTTADTAFALLLAAARRVAEADRFVRGGSWLPAERWSPDFFLGRDVSGATLGIVGLGAIGRAVARRAAGFGMRVLGWSRSAQAVPGVESVTFDELLAHSDFVSVHVALTDDTRGLLDADAIARMKPGAILVNTARGGIVDEGAVAAALDSGALYAAGFDVFEQEPVAADNPLLSHPRVVLTPHIGSATTRTRGRMVELAVANAVAALQGAPMPHCANPMVYRRD